MPEDDAIYLGDPELHPDKMEGLSDEQKQAAFEKSMRENFGDPNEELHPALTPWLDETESFGTVLKHPLVFSVPHHPGMNAMMNKALRMKMQMLDEYRADENWLGYVLAYERPYRLYGFEQIEDDISDNKVYWNVLGHIWTDSENIWQNIDDWAEFLDSGRGDREYLMDEDERAAWEKLPDTLTIHRGYKLDDAKLGMSWTLSYKRACWFARRLVRDGETSQVVTGTIPKAKALAYFTGRNEEEIVAFPDDIRITKTRVLNHRGEGPLGRPMEDT
jgi:hypothetical protein